LPVEAAHIFPYSLAKRKDDILKQKTDFYQVFELFFGAERAASLQECITGDPQDPRTNINRLENLITFTQHEHCFFGAGMIILEPVPGSQYPDNSAYDVVFKKLGRSAHTANQADLPINHPPTPLDERHAPDLKEVFLPHYNTRTEIQTGHIIRLTTTDPVTRPLPDPALLKLHADISRVVRMAGRAGIPEWEYSDRDHIKRTAKPKAHSATPTDPQPNQSKTAANITHPPLRTRRTIKTSLARLFNASSRPPAHVPSENGP
jgi:HNH endonuclease